MVGGLLVRCRQKPEHQGRHRSTVHLDCGTIVGVRWRTPVASAMFDEQPPPDIDFTRADEEHADDGYDT